MGKGKTKTQPLVGRYDIRKIGLEVEHVRQRLDAAAPSTAEGFPKKKVAGWLSVDLTGYRKKWKVEESRFHLEELGYIADQFGAPRGWPFVDWDTAQAMERALEGRPPDPPGAHRAPRPGGPGPSKGRRR